LDFLEPWFADANPSLKAELLRELIPGHILYGLPVTPVARRQDRDDVLFKIVDGSDKVAVVHLTYNRETCHEYPRASVFRSMDDWQVVMQVDNIEFNR
jgi:hypothetical protein